jgi:hypothetical protein
VLQRVSRSRLHAIAVAVFSALVEDCFVKEIIVCECCMGIVAVPEDLAFDPRARRGARKGKPVALRMGHKKQSQEGKTQ